MSRMRRQIKFCFCLFVCLLSYFCLFFERCFTYFCYFSIKVWVIRCDLTSQITECCLDAIFLSTRGKDVQPFSLEQIPPKKMLKNKIIKTSDDFEHCSKLSHKFDYVPFPHTGQLTSDSSIVRVSSPIFVKTNLIGRPGILAI